MTDAERDKKLLTQIEVAYSKPYWTDFEAAFLKIIHAERERVRLETLEEAAALIQSDDACDCNMPKAKYNTQSGHAMNCAAYLVEQIRTLANRS